MFHHLREDINSIIERDPAARNGWEVADVPAAVRAARRAEIDRLLAAVKSGK